VENILHSKLPTFAKVINHQVFWHAFLVQQIHAVWLKQYVNMHLTKVN